ncbi:MAG: bL21 family ribosomal protein, partial [bacterium]|nr:bL21 family ribosomal protein [bacterium]
MSKYGVIKTGGKQFLVQENDFIIVDKLVNEEKEVIDLETLAIFDTDSGSVELGAPDLAVKI